MTDDARVREMYNQHPISAAQVLSKVEAQRGSLEGLAPSDLFDHDQDHYGGLAANDAIAERAQLSPGMKVADFCAGLGGPARYMADRYGVRITGVELNAGRVAGARDLTHRVGLKDKLEVVEGDVTASGLPEAAFDAVISQEAFLHVPDKGAAIAEAHRILKPGGRFVFSDWIAHGEIEPEDSEVLWQGFAAQTLKSIPVYTDLLGTAGFSVESTDDLTKEWGPILEQRLAMYRKLREETAAAGLPQGEDAFYRAYVRLVALVQEGVLGGARLAARK